jgi:hypothetical protein
MYMMVSRGMPSIFEIFKWTCLAFIISGNALAMKHLFIHSKFHMKAFTHSCPYCTKDFWMKQQLNIHVLLHTGEEHMLLSVFFSYSGLSKELRILLVDLDCVFLGYETMYFGRALSVFQRNLLASSSG